MVKAQQRFNQGRALRLMQNGPIMIQMFTSGGVHYHRGGRGPWWSISLQSEREPRVFTHTSCETSAHKIAHVHENTHTHAVIMPDTHVCTK